MAHFKNKYQMLKASDDEIREFFATTIFEGVFSKEIKSNHSDYFKGHIHSIKINGESNNVIGTYINVPVSANDIPEGECTFKCRVKEEVRITPSQVSFSLSPKTLRSKNRSYLQPGSFGAEPVVIKQSDNSAEVKKIKTRLNKHASAWKTTSLSVSLVLNVQKVGIRLLISATRTLQKLKIKNVV